VTNWNQTHGNHLFLNTTSNGVSGEPKPDMGARIEARPNPAAGPMRIVSLGDVGTPSQTLTVYDMTGRVRRTLSGVNGTWTWDGRDDTGRPVAPGVYFAALGSPDLMVKLVRVSPN